MDGVELDLTDLFFIALLTVAGVIGAVFYMVFVYPKRKGRNGKRTEASRNGGTVQGQGGVDGADRPAGGNAVG